MKTPTPYFRDLAELLFGKDAFSSGRSTIVTDANVISQAYNELKTLREKNEDLLGEVGRFDEANADLKAKLARQSEQLALALSQTKG